MKVSGFTIVRNAVKLCYPLVESISSILPIVDEFIVNVGASEDETLKVVKGIRSPKIKVIETKWNMAEGPTVLSQQTNIALKECIGDWAFYLQNDEIVHEADLPRLYRCMQQNLNHSAVDALRFKWLHFYGSHYRYRIDSGWYQKQDRIIRNNSTVESFGDAYAFRRKDNQPLRTYNTGCYIYHYGWVFTPEQMALRRINSGEIWHDERIKEKNTGRYEFGDLGHFPVYFGSHPLVIKNLIKQHPITQEDAEKIHKKYWWHPAYILKIRYKTGRRIKNRIGPAA